MPYYRMFVVAASVVTSPLLAQTTPPVPAPGRDDPNRVICRREQVTGSLAGTRKVCMTRADWIASVRDTQEGAQRMQDAGRINSCGSAC